MGKPPAYLSGLHGGSAERFLSDQWGKWFHFFPWRAI